MTSIAPVASAAMAPPLMLHPALASWNSPAFSDAQAPHFLSSEQPSSFTSLRDIETQPIGLGLIFPSNMGHPALFSLPYPEHGDVFYTPVNATEADNTVNESTSSGSEGAFEDLSLPITPSTSLSSEEMRRSTSSSPSKKQRQQFVACSDCHARRVRCDLKDRQEEWDNEYGPWVLEIPTPPDIIIPVRVLGEKPVLKKRGRKSKAEKEAELQKQCGGNDPKKAPGFYGVFRREDLACSCCTDRKISCHDRFADKKAIKLGQSTPKKQPRQGTSPPNSPSKPGRFEPYNLTDRTGRQNTKVGASTDVFGNNAPNKTLQDVCAPSSPSSIPENSDFSMLWENSLLEAPVTIGGAEDISTLSHFQPQNLFDVANGSDDILPEINVQDFLASLDTSIVEANTNTIDLDLFESMFMATFPSITSQSSNQYPVSHSSPVMAPMEAIPSSLSLPIANNNVHSIAPSFSYPHMNNCQFMTSTLPAMPIANPTNVIRGWQPCDYSV